MIVFKLKLVEKFNNVTFIQDCWQWINWYWYSLLELILWLLLIMYHWLALSPWVTFWLLWMNTSAIWASIQGVTDIFFLYMIFSCFEDFLLTLCQWNLQSTCYQYQILSMNKRLNQFLNMIHPRWCTELQ